MPQSLGHETSGLPPTIREIIVKARTSWLKNTEVMELLQNHESYGLPVGREAPDCPGGGSLFLFNRKAVRFFRKDGHEWRKKADGKTVRETHEKLKIDNKDALNCYYAHAEAKEALQRRCYWLLDGDGDIVLVHYLSSNSPARQPSAAAAASLSNAASSGRRSHAQGGQGLSRAGSLPVCLEQTSLQQAVTITTGEAPRVQICEMLSNGSCDSSQQPGFSGHFSPQVALEVNNNPRAASSPAPGDDLLSALSCGLPLDGLTDRKRNLGMLRCAPSAFASALQGGGRSYSHWQSSRQDSRHSSQSAATELSFPLDPLAFALDPQMHLPRGRIPRRHSGLGRQGGLPPLAVDQTEASEMQRMGSEVGETYELKPAVSLTRVDSDTLKIAPSLSMATSGIREALPGAQAPEQEPRSAAAPTIPSSSASPFFAAAFTGNPIRKGAGARPPQDVSAEEDVAPRWHSTSALGHMRQISNDRAASTTASDFGRLDLERRSSKRHRSGMLSARPSVGSMASEPLLPGGLAGDTPQSIFGDIQVPGAKSLGAIPQGLMLESPGLNWQIPTGKVGFEGVLPAWRGETYPPHSVALNHVLPEPLLPDPGLSQLPEPMFARASAAEMALPILQPGDLEWDLRFLH